MLPPMTLDPQIQTFLDQTAQLDLPPVAERPVAEVRLNYEVVAAMAPVPDGVSTSDVTVTGGAGDLAARIYRARHGVTPGLVYFHGGGHVIGNLATHDSACGLLARDSGCTVISVDYRLAPEHPFPADVEDAVAATAWVAEHAGELDVDPGRLAVGGDSAGGNLAAAVARQARDAGDPPLAAQLLIYPWVDVACDRPSMHENAAGKFMHRADLEFWRDLYVEGDASRYTDPDVSALWAEDFSGLPPAVVVTAAGDPLCDQGDAYAKTLADAGVEVRHLAYPDLIHAFIQLTAISERAAVATTELARELGGLLDA